MPVIVGSPRSGTTLLRFMLDAHPQLAIPPETGFLAAALKFKDRGDKLRQKLFHTITNFPSEVPTRPDFELSRESIWSSLIQIEPFNVAEGYRAFYRLYAARFDKPRWSDKTPHYCFELDTIRHVLPEARFIHLIRDGRDVALSLRKMWFSPGWEIETQAAYWQGCVQAARKAGTGHYDYLEVRYEELVLNTDSEVLRAFTGKVVIAGVTKEARMKIIWYLLALVLGAFGALGLVRSIERLIGGAGVLPVQILIGLVGLVLAWLCFKKARSASSN